MNIFKTYIEALNSGDPKRFAALFTEDGVFDDCAGRPFGIGSILAEGRQNIEQTFAGLFAQFKLKAELLDTKNNTMEYNIYLGEELTIPCVSILEESDGLIKFYTIRPLVKK